jgi:hypothetical protein
MTALFLLMELIYVFHSRAFLEKGIHLQYHYWPLGVDQWAISGWCISRQKIVALVSHCGWIKMSVWRLMMGTLVMLVTR